MNILVFFYVSVLLVLNSCTSIQNYPKNSYPESNRKYPYDIDGAHKKLGVDPAKVQQPIPKAEVKSRYGNPKSYSVYGKRYKVLNKANGYTAVGGASWYGKKFHGERTSSGETYDMYAMTAAHKTLPLPTYVRVTNLDNKRSLIVKVNDRGPFHQGRIIDLSYSAAWQLDIIRKGVGRVKVEAITDFTKIVKRTVLTKSKPVSIIIKNNQTYIQIGAFSNSKNAQKLALKARVLLGKPVEVEQKVINKKLLSIVKVGPLNDLNNINLSIKKLVDNGFKSVQILKPNTQ